MISHLSLSFSLTQSLSQLFSEKPDHSFMAADVTSLVRVLAADNHNHRTESNESNTQKPTAMITRDLFHASSNSALQSQELDLDLHVPAGWEKRLDLQSGKVYIKKCKNSLISSERKLHMNSSDPKLQDLNFPPSPISKRRRPLNLFDDTSLDLKLMSSSSSSSSTSSLPSNNNSNYTSVCTLDKVKFALERAEKKEPNPPINNNNIKKLRTTSSFWKPSNTTLSSSSPSYSSSSSSIRESEESEEKLFSSLSSSSSSSSPLAVGCPGCLSYVLIMKNNPKCPRCKSIVPFPLMKKPRIDLNISI